MRLYYMILLASVAVLANGTTLSAVGPPTPGSFAENGSPPAIGGGTLAPRLLRYAKDEDEERGIWQKIEHVLKLRKREIPTSQARPISQADITKFYKWVNSGK
ncbi:hypothetical protein F442_00569 [Phytophthora nicotianae P10297]|uniref:RxLR effector protein n=4 Tax=Phytophthora nicotianae TaxID=4792 RepID=W2RFK2_PHYN3|nr:hypothetical protein PPTG_20748 [Phytophthora nicotianae INRA-310]ETM03230.1 hypothetical protein L917_00523 [Phytophthora nicotianae]ETO85806.1 hypothetical protein F444_00577 [Phytophthora nicotianae P1976]ETP54803.1 hypothetical protein F442_00569 [Phytophthora nicotianae P10297]ETM56497.1 hypothetical protein L914_00542 [Phytophthora nicotianae]ETN24021.1 hypothetical protein PPTG_20748 [Phytophthora nicotianae INRA-310]